MDFDFLSTFFLAKKVYYPIRRDGRYDAICPDDAAKLWSEPFHLWQRSPQLNLTMMKCISLLAGLPSFWALYENDQAAKTLPSRNEFLSVYDRPGGPTDAITPCFGDVYHVVDQFLCLSSFTNHLGRILIKTLRDKMHVYTHEDLELAIQWLPPSVLRSVVFLITTRPPTWEDFSSNCFLPFGRAHWCKLPLFWPFITYDHRTFLGHLNENIDKGALFESLLVHGHEGLDEVSNYFKLCCYGHNYMRSSTPVHQVEIVDQTIDQLYNLLSTTACATTQAEENELLRSATQAVQNQVIKNFPGWTDTSEPDEVQPQVIIFRTNFFC